jgi:hypothetical protein
MTLKKILEITKPDEYNFILPRGLGDSMDMCALKQAIIEKYDAPIHFIIKPAHEIVMYIYNISDYSIHLFTEDELRGIGKNNHHPVKGELYVAHPIYSYDCGFFEYKLCIHNLQFFQFLFRVDNNCTLLRPVKYPEITAKISKDFPQLDKTALLLPEARSIARLKRGFWETLAGELREKGFTVVQSYSSEDFKIEGIEAMPDDINYVTALAIHCSAVYALRNGLCDVIAGKAKRLVVFYPSQQKYSFYYMDYDNVENILVGIADKKTVYSITREQRIPKLKRKLKKIVKMILKIALKTVNPIRQFVKRFCNINKRIGMEISHNPTESYNDMLDLARIRGQGNTGH